MESLCLHAIGLSHCGYFNEKGDFLTAPGKLGEEDERRV